MEVKILLNQRKGVKMPNVGEEQIQPQDSLKEKKKKKHAFTFISLATVEVINIRLM